MDNQGGGRIGRGEIGDCQKTQKNSHNAYVEWVLIVSEGKALQVGKKKRERGDKNRGGRNPVRAQTF